MKIYVSPDFEYLDTLPIEQYNKLEEDFLIFVTKEITRTEEDYCKKKGLTLKEVRKDFKLHNKMRNAVNQRKYMKKLIRDLMGFNKVLRWSGLIIK